jgi:hypothetical protein
MVDIIKEVRLLAREVLLIGGAIFLIFYLPSHLFPPNKPVTVTGKGSVSVVASPEPAEVTIQAAISADRANAALSATQKSYSNLLNSYESLIAQGLQPRYVPKLTVQAQLVAPKPTPLPTAPPGWTQQQTKVLYDTDRAAVASVFNDPNTKLNINATLTQVEAPQARIGTILMPSGSGVAYDVIRKGQYDLEAGGVVHHSHISPALSLQYSIPHTSLSCGVGAAYDHRVLLGPACTVRITH